VLAKEQKKNQLKKRNREKENHTRKVCILALELTVLDTVFGKNYHN